MKKGFVAAVMIIAGIFTCQNASAIEFLPVGSEAMSMGGAGVASARGGYAPYYNPALLAEYKSNADIVFAVSAGVRNIDLAERIDSLSDMNVEESIENLEKLSDPARIPSDVENIGNFIDEVLSIDRKNGLQLSPGFNLGCQIKQFGIGLYMVSDVVANAVIDKEHKDIIIKTETEPTTYLKYDPNNPSGIPALATFDEYRETSIQYALDNGLTYIDLTGLAYIEIPVSGAYRFSTAIGNIDVGGSLKLMPGYTLDRDIKVDTSSGDVSTDLREDTKTSLSWGIDLGVLFKPRNEKLNKLSVGFVGKNLNTPKFKTASSDYLKAKPMARIGVAYDFFDGKLSAALDADLTRNETYLPDYYSQYIGGGLNFKPADWVSLRAGLMQNIQETDEGLIITAGAGIGHRLFMVDLSLLSSTKAGKMQGTSVPEVFKIQLGISSSW